MLKVGNEGGRGAVFFSVADIIQCFCSDQNILRFSCFSGLFWKLRCFLVLFLQSSSKWRKHKLSTVVKIFKEPKPPACVTEKQTGWKQPNLEETQTSFWRIFVTGDFCGPGRWWSIWSRKELHRRWGWRRVSPAQLFSLWNSTQTSSSQTVDTGRRSQGSGGGADPVTWPLSSQVLV